MPPPISDLLRSRQPRNSIKNDTSPLEDTVLPLHKTPANKGHPTSRFGSPNASVNNNFLLGGMYVPNKDHRRRRMGRSKYRKFYPFIDRIFVCPTTEPCRRSVKFIVILFGVVSLHYGIVFYMQLRPTVNHSSSPLHQFRRPTYFGNRHENLLQDSTLSKRLLSMTKERNILQTIYKKRQQQQRSSVRLKILEGLVPDWFHRNDLHASKSKRNETPRKPDPNSKTDQKSDRTNEQRQKPSDKANERNAIDAREFRTAAPKRRARTLLNMEAFANTVTSSCPLDLSSNDLSVSLVIQSTLDRIWILQETCQRWKSPIVLVIAVRPNEPLDLLHLLRHKEACPQLNVILYQMNSEVESTPEQYPVNALRNVALDAVKTSHILVMDVDFVPSDQLDQVILLVLSEQLIPTPDGVEATGGKIAMVVPAFERVLYPPCTTDMECAKHLQKDSMFIPQTFEELKECYDSHNCMVFQKEVNWEGHSSTRTKSWLQKKWYNDNDDARNENQEKKHESLKIRTIPCFDSLRYEPYVVLRWCPASKKGGERTNPQAPVAPYYDERFHGYGKNKIQLISHLRIMGYQFHVLPKGFLVHNPHVESASKETWNQRNDEHSLHHDMDVLYQTFLRELMDKYLAAQDQPSKIVNACGRHEES
jgi:Glycosyl-transferase for dystroglycan